MMALAAEMRLTEGQLRRLKINKKQIKIHYISIQYLKAESFQKDRAKFWTV
jgi:hypothetical protein